MNAQKGFGMQCHNRKVGKVADKLYHVYVKIAVWVGRAKKMSGPLTGKGKCQMPELSLGSKKST
eukprot:15342118-Ditylum_brightwellii.AAC.1